MAIAANQHLVLVGMMGAGKSTVARLAAARLGRRVLDSDAVIEAAEGRTIREIFVTDGEPAFRRLETQVLVEALADPEPAVIAAAGGVVLSDINRRALCSSSARVVWLCANPTTLEARVLSAHHRPLLDNDPSGTLQRMFIEREHLYREVADLIVSVDSRSVSEVVEAVLR